MRQRTRCASRWRELTPNPSLNPEPNPNPNSIPIPDQVHHKMTRSTRSRLLWCVPRATMPPRRARRRHLPSHTHTHICSATAHPPTHMHTLRPPAPFALLRPPLHRFTVAEAVVLVRPRSLSLTSAKPLCRPCSPASPRPASPRPAPPRPALSLSLGRPPTCALRCTVQVAVSLWQILYLKSFFEIKRVV